MRTLVGKSGRFLWSALAVVAVCDVAQAQWSSDPSNNLIVSDLAGGATQPKIVPVSDGGFYISWLGNAADGYDIYLQRVDAQGRSLWASSGVLIADRSYQLVVDYGLCVDGDDNAYLAYACCTFQAPADRINVQKIASDGSFRWGANAVPASATNRDVVNSACTVASDGDVIAAWSQSGGVYAQKLDANGHPVWTQDGVRVSQGSHVDLLANIGASTMGDAIVSWSDLSGSDRAMFAQKLGSADGSGQWSLNRVFATGNLETLYYALNSDGAGGAVLWESDMSGTHDVPRVQHLDATGAPLFGADGVVATTDTTIDHTNTAGYFDASTGDIYLVWRDARDDGAQTAEGVSAQRIDPTGALTWGDTGEVLAPLVDSDGADAISQVAALPAPDGFVASWVVGVAPALDHPLRATYLDVDGNAIWPSGSVDVKTTRQTTGAAAAVSTNGFFAYAWSDTEAGSDPTIRAQNVNLDGSLGIPAPEDTIFGDGFDGD